MESGSPSGSGTEKSRRGPRFFLLQVFVIELPLTKRLAGMQLWTVVTFTVVVTINVNVFW